MPRFRFTVRRMMVAVAVAGVLAAIGARTLRERAVRDRYRAMATSHDLSQTGYLNAAVTLSMATTNEFRPKIAALESDLQALERLPSALTAAEDDEIRRKKAAIRRRIEEAKAAERAAGLRVRAILDKAHYHRSLSTKYRMAARDPWLPVVPDPPEPG